MDFGKTIMETLSQNPSTASGRAVLLGTHRQSSDRDYHPPLEALARTSKIQQVVKSISVVPIFVIGLRFPSTLPAILEIV